MSKHSFILAALLVCSTTLLAQTTPPQTGQPPLNQNTQSEAEKAQNPNPTRPADPLAERDRALQKLDAANKSGDPEAVDTMPAAGRQARQGGAVAPIQGDVVVTDVSPGPDLSRDYTGPAVLTRSYAVERPSVPENIKFRPFVGFNSGYDTGLTSITVRPDGTTDNRPLFSTVINFGIEGRHFWRHDIVELTYTGNVNKYLPNSSYDGSNHALAFNWTHQLSRRIKLSLVENASRYTLGYILSNPIFSPDVSVANVSLSTAPNVQVFDTVTTQSTSSVNLTYQRSARLSFDLSGTYFLTKRTQSGLVNSKGDQAGFDTAYRFTRKTTAGVYYMASQYRYSGGAGNTFANTVGGIYSYALDARTEFRARFGLTVMENLGIVAISVDPAIAQLLGQASAQVQYYSVTNTPDLSFSLSRVLRGNRSIHAAYTRGITPGNGVFVTSSQQLAEIGANFTFARKYRVALNINRNELTSTSQQVGQFTSDAIHTGLSRSLNRHIQWDIGFDYRHFEITSSPLLRNQYRTTVGFTWSNEEFPAKVF